MITKVLVAAVAAAMLSGTAFAAKGGGGGGADGGGHMPSAATLNSNGPGSLDRDKGVDRAMDRRSDAGIAHAARPVVTPVTPAVVAPKAEPARAIPQRSTMGRLNTNNPSSPHRATGLARAEYRHDMKDARTLRAHRVATKAKPHKPQHKVVNRTARPSTVIHRVNEAPDFRAQARAHRIAQARLNWERSRRS